MVRQIERSAAGLAAVSRLADRVCAPVREIDFISNCCSRFRTLRAVAAVVAAAASLCLKARLPEGVKGR